MPTYKLLARLLYFLLDLVVLLLAARLLLRLSGANPSAGFAEFVFRMSAPLMAPFSGLFPPARFQGASLDWSVLAAIAVYIAFTFLVVRLVRIVMLPPESSAVAREVEEDFHEE